jgi:putative oxidoreductase
MATLAHYSGAERRNTNERRITTVRAATPAYDAAEFVPLAGRILMSAIFLLSGARKLFAFAATAVYMAKLGFPAPEAMAALAIVIELGAGLLLLTGWHTRAAAWLLALFVLIAAFAAHRFWEFDAAQFMNQMNHFMKNLAIIGGLLAYGVCGPGRISLDKR